MRWASVGTLTLPRHVIGGPFNMPGGGVPSSHGAREQTSNTEPENAASDPGSVYLLHLHLP